MIWQQISVFVKRQVFSCTYVKKGCRSMTWEGATSRLIHEPCSGIRGLSLLPRLSSLAALEQTGSFTGNTLKQSISVYRPKIPCRCEAFCVRCCDSFPMKPTQCPALDAPRLDINSGLHCGEALFLSFYTAKCSIFLLAWNTSPDAQREKEEWRIFPGRLSGFPPHSDRQDSSYKDGILLLHMGPCIHSFRL